MSTDAKGLEVLLESLAATSARLTWFGRLEIVGKAAHDLHADEFDPAIVSVMKLQLGLSRTLTTWRSLAARLGASVDTAVVPAALAPRYNGRVAPGLVLFLHLSSTGAHHH